MSRPEPAVTLRQIDELCKEAEGLAAGFTLDTLLEDRVRTRAWERMMEIIGEAVKRLPGELRERYPKYGRVLILAKDGLRWMTVGDDERARKPVLAREFHLADAAGF